MNKSLLVTILILGCFGQFNSRAAEPNLLRYKVVKGDTLEGILHRMGKKAYGPKKALSQIVELNKDKLSEGANSYIFPGMVLVIPFESLAPQAHMRVENGHVIFDEAELAPTNSLPLEPATLLTAEPAYPEVGETSIPAQIATPVPTPTSSQNTVTKPAKAQELFPEAELVIEQGEVSKIEPSTELIDYLLSRFI